MSNKNQTSQPPKFTFEVFLGLLGLLSFAIGMVWLLLFTGDKWATEHKDELPPLSAYFARYDLEHLNALGIYTIRCEPNKGCYAYTTTGDYTLPNLNQNGDEKKLDIGLDVYKRYQYGVEVYGNYPSVLTLKESTDNMQKIIDSFSVVVAKEKPAKDAHEQEIKSSWSRH